MEVHSIGYHHVHGSNFLMEQLEGIGQGWLFLLIKTPAKMLIKGEIIQVKPNSVMIYYGDIPQHYGASGETYIDDWFYFTVEAMDLALLRELAIPIGEPIALEDISELTDLIRTMTYEHHTHNLYSADLVDLYLKILLFKLSRVIHSTVRTLPESGKSRYDGMIRLRKEIYTNVTNIPPVSEMARHMSMSQSAFQHTYKKIFGTNVMYDINQARIQQAKELLVTTTLPLRQIAERSGYSSEFHLMRHFKKHTGMTPTEFRKRTQ